MAKIIHVDFAARVRTEAPPEEATDVSNDSLEELLRDAENELSSADAGAHDLAEDETICPICRKSSCRLWRGPRGLELTLVK